MTTGTDFARWTKRYAIDREARQIAEAIEEEDRNLLGDELEEVLEALRDEDEVLSIREKHRTFSEAQSVIELAICNTYGAEHDADLDGWLQIAEDLWELSQKALQWRLRYNG